MTTQIVVRLADEQLARIDQVVGQLHESRSDLIRRAIDVYLDRLAGEHDAAIYARVPLSDRELAFVDDPQAWEGTPAW